MPAPKPRKRTQQRFEKGFLVVPKAWVEALKAIDYPPAHAAAFYLLWRRWSQKEDSFPISKVVLVTVGIGWRARLEALRRLQAAGLITLEPGSSGKAPVVTLHKLN